MASFSNSSIHKSNFKYDVFLSFRGEDTRTNFVDHLYDALKKQNIETYKDDKNLRKGNIISKELIKAIEESRFHVIVFSKNYASSSWCLDELVKIMECQKTQTEQTVYPIFYDVEPTEVRKQSGAFGEAIARHENEVGAKKWTEALKEAADLGGWELKKTANGHEVEFIKIVVKDISLKVPVVGGDENLIGMRTRVNDVVSYLKAFPDEFCMIGIWGMGGSGKTTLARAVFDQICDEFEGISFIENVREVSNSPLLGLKWLQQQVLRDVLNTQDINVNGVFDGKTMMKRKMPGRNVLVVLDDVDHIDQLKALAGEPNWFNPRSKVIITTRDKQVLIAHKVKLIHDVNLLTHDKAIRLLSRCAFGTESPSPGFKELLRKVASYAAGLPLTITILGSFLCEANEHIWIDTLERLKKIPLEETLQKLELSYMGLDIDCKEMFLDIACILKGWKEDEAIRALESCGFHAIRGLSVLEKKSLITISRDGRLDMHDHIEEMGRYIVRRSNLNEPERHTRLWIEEEIKDILANNQGTKATTCVNLFVSGMNLETVMKGLGKMEKIRLLYVYIDDIYSDWKLDEDRQYFPNSLQYLNWLHYPFCSLPNTFQATNLVTLEMRGSGIVQLWEGGERKVLHKLRFLDFSSSQLKAFDLGLTPNIEILDLQYCYDFVELHMPLQCPKLKSLKLGQSKLSTLDLRLVPNIETLDLNPCPDLVELDMPYECPQLKYFNLSSSKLMSLNLGLTPNIETLNLECCDGLVKLDMSRECPQLKALNLSCPNLRFFNHGLTPNIETLKVEECDYLVELDMFLKCPQLKSLDLMISMLRTLDFGPTPDLDTLKLQVYYNSVELRMQDECYKLKTLILRCPELRTFEFGLTQNLEVLTLDGHDDLVKLLISVGCPQLRYLKIINSKLRTLELTLNIKSLVLEYCELVELHFSYGDVKLESLHFKTCLQLKTLDLRGTPNLKILHLIDCPSLVKLHAPIQGLKKLVQLKARVFLAQVFLRFKNFEVGNKDVLLPELHLFAESVDICPWHPDNNFPKFQFNCSYREDLPSSIGNIEKLISEGYSCACTDLQSFFGSICGLQNLRKLYLQGSIPEAPKDLDRLQCLEELTFWSTNIKHLPDSICMLKHLKSLEVYECTLLEKLPDDLGRLECLETLSLTSKKIKHLPDSICMLKHLKILKLIDFNLLEKLSDDLGQLECLETLNLERCIVLQDIPNSLCQMKSLKYFHLCYCMRVEELPEELGRLECLEELDITGTCINNLPPSILLLVGLRIVRSEDEIPTTTTTTMGGCCTVL